MRNIWVWSRGFTRRVAAAIALAAACGIAFTAIATAGAKSIDSPLDSPEIQAAHKRAVADANADDARRNSGEALSERQRSRVAFGNQTDVAAANTARTLHPEVFAASQDPIRPPTGMNFVGFVNDNSARFSPSDGSGPRAIVTSTLPVRPIEGGRPSQPIELSLFETSEGFKARNPGFPLSIGHRLGDGTELGARHLLRFKPASMATDRRGTIEGSAAFFANAARDTDYIVSPIPAGAEAFFHLRSVDSPEEFRLAFDLPHGAHFAGRSNGSLAVVDAGKDVALVTAPRAWDDDGTSVRTSMRIAGGDLILTIAHRSADIAYPVILDPAVLQISRTWSWYQSDPNTSGWQFQTPYPNFGPYADASGLYSRNLTASFFGDGWWGKWFFQAPGTTWIGDAWMTNIDHDRQGYGGTCFYTSLEDSAGNPYAPSYQEVCSNAAAYVRGTVCCMSSGTRGNKLAFGEAFHGSADRTYWEHLGGVTIDLFDDDDPTVSVTVPTGWTNNRAAPITFQAHDAGSGVQSAYLYYPGATWNGRVDVGPTSCTRAYCGHDAPASAAQTTVGNLPDGSNDLIGHVVDVAGHTRDYGPYTVKVDTTPPSISLSDRLATLDGKETFVDDYPLHISATDGSASAPRSGVTSVVLKVDGIEEARTPPASPAQSMTLDWVLDGSRFESSPAATHEIEIVATDAAGNVRSSTITVYPTFLDPMPSEQEQLDYSKQFRVDYGLRADDAWIQSLMNDRAYDPAREKWGLPLTDAETQEVDRQQSADTLDADNSLDAKAHALGDYADSYIAGGQIYVGFTANAQQHFNDLRAQVTYPDRLELFAAEHTVDELDQIRVEIEQDTPMLALTQGIHVISIGDNVPANRLDVGVADDPTLAASYFGLRYGNAVAVSQETPPVEAAGHDYSKPSKRRSNLFGAIVGGLTIYPDSHTPSWCTAGFIVNGNWIGPSQQGMLTAGHCFPNSRLHDDWYQGWWGYGTGQRLGRPVKKVVGGNADVGVLPIPSNLVAAGMVYQATGSRYQTINRIQYAGDPRYGESVCFTAATTGKRCGRLIGKKQEFTVNGTHFDHWSLINKRCRAGDSGAPVYYSDVAKGLVGYHRGNRSECLFSKADYDFGAALAANTIP